MAMLNNQMVKKKQIHRKKHMFQSKKKRLEKKHTHTHLPKTNPKISQAIFFFVFFQNPFPITNPKKKNYHTNFQQKPTVSWWTLPCTTVDLDDPTWGCGSLVNGSNSPELWKIHRTINMGFIIISQKISGINMDYHHHIPVYIYMVLVISPVISPIWVIW